MAEHKRQRSTEFVANSPANELKFEEKTRYSSKDEESASAVVVDNWSNFEVKRVLNNNVVRKQIWLEGRFRRGQHDDDDDDDNTIAVVLLEKKSFPEETECWEKIFSQETLLKSVFDNDAYGSYECFPPREHNGFNTTIIYPATQKHLDKFTKKEVHLVEETPELYKTVTIPKATGQRFSLQWIENIFNHKSETDRIIYEDTDEEKGFVLLPDLKWDGNINTLNVLAISRLKINSIRELNQTHLPLLRNIRAKGVAAIVDKYGVSVSRLRVFFHYLPSYYHLHVHFTDLSVEDAGAYTEKAHLLSTVISNIELLPDYYQKVTLTFAVFDPNLAKDYGREEAASPGTSDKPEEERRTMGNDDETIE